MRLKVNPPPDNFYDWGEVPPRKLCGYYLRDPKNLNLLNQKTSGVNVDFTTADLCIVLGRMRNHVHVLNPRFESGMIHEDKVEVVG